MKNSEQFKNFLIRQGWKVETTEKDEFGVVTTLLIDPVTKALVMFHPITGMEFFEHADATETEVQIVVCITSSTLQIYVNSKLTGEAAFNMQDKLLSEFFGVKVKSKLLPGSVLHCEMPDGILIISAIYID